MDGFQRSRFSSRRPRYEQGAGMLDLDRSLVNLVRERLITLEDARFRARSPEAFQNYLRILPTTDD